jgi:hypothetical protein
MKSDFGTMNSTHYFLHICNLDFEPQEAPILQTLRRFYGVLNFSRYPYVEFLFFASYETLEFES